MAARHLVVSERLTPSTHTSLTPPPFFQHPPLHPLRHIFSSEVNGTSEVEETQLRFSQRCEQVSVEGWQEEALTCSPSMNERCTWWWSLMWDDNNISWGYYNSCVKWLLQQEVRWELLKWCCREVALLTTWWVWKKEEVEQRFNKNVCSCLEKQRPEEN